MVDGPNWEVFERPRTGKDRVTTDAIEVCDKPSRYRYQRGCRCDGCVKAQSIYKRAYNERKAQEEGRVYGERPCERCGTPISRLGAARKQYCDLCGTAVLREQQADYRRRHPRSERRKVAGATTKHSPATIKELPVERITIGDDVRLDEDDEALEDLASSIEEFGVLQPLVVRPIGDGWEVVAGRRRLVAARLVEVDVVPCVIRELDDDRAFDITLAENLHRRDLSWIEVALGYKRLRDRGLKGCDIADLVGKHESQVSQVLKLLTLPQELQDRVHSRELSYGDALRLHRYGDPKGGPNGARGEGTGGGDSAAIHWRGRHERLLAGIAQIMKARDADEVELRRMLDRLLKLDRQPLLRS